MAEFTASPIASPAGTPDLYDTVQHNSLLNMGLDQDLQDRATFRQNAPGLLARDPTATGQAMGANPAAAQAFLSSIPNMDANTREQASSDIAASGSLAGAVLSQPADQRQAAWDAGRQTLIASGHKMVPPETYPGDGALQTMRGLASTAQQQFEMTPQIPTVNPTPYLASTPGGGYVGPGGVQGQSGGGVTATPLPAPGQQGSGYNGALGASESGNNPAAVNGQGYSGQYQFGTGRLTDLGFYQPAQGEDPNGNQWRGTFNIPGYPQVKTQADFLHNVSAQNAVQAASSADIQNQIAQTPGAQNYDPNGLAAVAHLGGVAGMQKFVATNGQYNPADANGTRLSDYYQRFSTPGGQGQRPVQVADASRTAGMPQTATDAAPSGVSGSAVGARIQQQRQQGFTIPPSAASNSSQPGAVVPPAGPVSAAPGSYDPNNVTNVDTPAQAQGLPGNAPWRLPDGTVHMNAPQAEPVLVPPVGGSRSNALLLPPRPQAAPVQPSTAAGPGGNQNALSGSGAIAPTAPNQLTGLGITGNARAPNALLPASQPSAPTPTQVSAPPAAAPTQLGAPAQAPRAPVAPQQPAAGALPFLRDPRTYQMLPVPNQPGYAYAQGPGGQWVAQRIPGSPGAGVDVQNVAGHQYVTDKQTGQLMDDRPIANAMRTTTVQGPNGTIVMQGDKQVGVIPFSTQPAQIATYQRDSDVIGKQANLATQAEQNLQQTLEARNLARGLPTGAGGENRAAIASVLKTFAPDSIYQAALNTGFVPDSPQAEQTAKLLLRGAATDEQSLGGSGGLGMTEKFQKANPNLNMQPESIQAILNLKAVTAQAAKDYADGATGYFNQQQDAILHQGGQYQPLSNFNQQWHSQRNVQTYMAAVDALNGRPISEWGAKLAPEDQDRVFGIINRIDPGTKVAGVPNVGTVLQGYRFNGGNPNNPSSWARVQ